MRSIWKIFALAALASGQASPLQAAESPPSQPASKITYEEHVAPLFRDQCFACHGQDRKSSGLRLNSFAAVMAGGSSGEAVKPGDPANSRLYQLVTQQQEPHMPPKSPPMPKEKLDLIRRWIEGGALEGAGSKVVAVNKPKVDFSLLSVVKGKPDGPPPMPPRLSLEPVVHTGRPGAITALAASPWAPLVAVAGQKQVLLYHAETLDLLGILPFPEGIPHVLKFSRNGSLLLAGGGHAGKAGRVVVWSVKTGERLFEIGDESDCVLAADISADQTQIALGGPSKMVRVYSTRDGKMLYEIKKHTDWLYALEFSPDGVLLASGDRNGGLFVWEANTGREFFSLRGHTAAVTDLSWRADANVLASASEDGTIRLWEMENGSQVKSWGAHGSGVEAIRFALDGRIISGGRDNTVKVWDPNGNQQRAFEPFPDVTLRVAFTQDAGRAIGGDWTGQIRVWTTADGKQVGTLLADPPTLAQRLESMGKELATLRVERDRLTGVATLAQQAADKIAVDLAAAQKDAVNRNAALPITTAALAKTKETSNQANAALGVAQTRVKTQEASVKVLGEAAAKAKEAADKTKGDQKLAAAAAGAQQLLQKAMADLVSAQKAVADSILAAKQAADQVTAAQQAADKTPADLAAANQRVTMLTSLSKTTAEKAGADKAAASKAAALCEAMEQKYQGVLAQSKLSLSKAAPGGK